MSKISSFVVCNCTLRAVGQIVSGLLKTQEVIRNCLMTDSLLGTWAGRNWFPKYFYKPPCALMFQKGPTAFCQDLDVLQLSFSYLVYVEICELPIICLRNSTHEIHLKE